MKRWIIVVVVVAGLAIIGAAAYFGYLSSRPPGASLVQAPPTVPVSRGDVVLSVTAPGQAHNTRQVDLSMGAAGQLAEVTVQPGQAVKKGQVLARLADRAAFEAAVTAAQHQVSLAQRALDDLAAQAPTLTAAAQMALVQANQDLAEAQTKREGLNYQRASRSRINQVESDYQGALQAVAQAEADFSKVSGRPVDDPKRIQMLSLLSGAVQQRDYLLSTLNFIQAKPSDQEIAQADAKLAQARAAQGQAQAAWERVKDGPDPRLLEDDQYALATAQANLAAAQGDLQKVELTAPFDGVIIAVQAGAGQTVSPTSPVVTLVDPLALEVQATVVEEDYPLISTGQSVTLYFDALPDANLSGRVERIIPKRLDGSQPNYGIVISLDSLAGRMVAGMSVDASIVIHQSQGVLRLPRAVVRPRSDGTAQVDVWNGLAVEKRTIQVGLRGDSYTEVLSGLVEGEQVVAR